MTDRKTDRQIDNQKRGPVQPTGENKSWLRVKQTDRWSNGQTNLLMDSLVISETAKLTEMEVRRRNLRWKYRS